MKKLIKLGLALLVLVLLVATWEDNFKIHGGDRLIYLENYDEIREKYLGQGPSYLDLADLKLWDIKQAARQVQDYEFLIYILSDKDLAPGQLEDNQLELLEVLVEAGYYGQAQDLALELLDQEKSQGENYSRPRLGLRYQGIYKALIRLYSQEQNSQAMEAIYYEIKEKHDLADYSLDPSGQEDFSYLEQIIRTSENPRIREEIMEDLLGEPLSIGTMFFIAQEAGPSSKYMDQALEKAQILVDRKPGKNMELKVFLDLYPDLDLASLLAYQDRVLILEEGQDLRLIYLDSYSSQPLVAEKLVQSPVNYEIFYTNGLVLNRPGSSLVLNYNTSYLIEEFVAGKIIGMELEPDYYIDRGHVRSKKLGQDIKIKGDYRSKDLYIEEDVIYEIIRFYQEADLSSVVLNQYELDQGGYIELVKMERIF